MKAIRVHGFGGPEVLKWEDAADPKPGKGQVLVRARAVGVNPVDAYIRAGWYMPKSFPYVPGMDAAGDVEAVGEGVTNWKVGDRVYVAGTVSGAYAEKVLCEQTQIFCLPANVTYAQGACMGVPCATAYRALFNRGWARAGETLLVHGASGGVGTAAVQLAAAAGLIVFGTAGSEAGLKLVAELGATEVLDHRKEDYLKRVVELTDKKGANLILEMLANVNLAKDLEVLAKYGRVVVIGSRAKVEIDPRLTMGRDLDIRGMSLMNASSEELQGIHAGLVAALKNGTLKPVVGKEMPLSEAEKSHREILEGHAPGNVVLKV